MLRVSSSQSSIRAHSRRWAPTWQWAPAPSASVKLPSVAGAVRCHQFLGLAEEELVGLAAADEHRAGDLLGDPAAQL